MATFIENVLDIHAINAITEALQDDSLFEDGKVSAGAAAKKVKNNVQGKMAGPVQGVVKMIEQKLQENAVLRSAALPRKFAKIMVNRYDEGMTYGAHVDDAFIAGTRTDLSFTLFLSDPESYEGGELIVQRDDGDEAIKLPQGSLYLYPSDSIHYVAPVTRGSRLSVVGWIQSKVRSQEQRQILFDLSSALKQLPTAEANQQARLKLLKVHNNLLRRWAD